MELRLTALALVAVALLAATSIDRPAIEDAFEDSKRDFWMTEVGGDDAEPGTPRLTALTSRQPEGAPCRARLMRIEHVLGGPAGETIRSFYFVNGLLELIHEHPRRAAPASPGSRPIAERRFRFDMGSELPRVSAGREQLRDAVEEQELIAQASLFRVLVSQKQREIPDLGACRVDLGDPAAVLDAAGELHELDPEQARNYYQYLVEHGSESARIHYDLARLEGNCGMGHVGHLRRALQLDAGFDRARLGLAVCLVQRRDADARQHIDLLLAERPRDGELLALHGKTLIAEGQFRDAAAALEASLTSRAGSFETNLLLAYLLTGLEEYATARVAGRRALAAATDARQRARALDAAGRIAVREGADALAVESFRAARAADPTWGPPLFEYANALRRLGRFEPALEAYAATLTLLPQHVEARINLATTLALAGRGDEARETITLPPAGRHGKLGWAVVALLASSPRTSDRERALALVEDFDHTLWRTTARAHALAGLGRYEEASELQRRFVGETRFYLWYSLDEELTRAERNLARFERGERGELPTDDLPPHESGWDDDRHHRGLAYLNLAAGPRR